MVQEQLPLCARILEFFDWDREYAVVSADMVLRWNRAHRSGKYATREDKKLFIRTAAQFLNALESPTASLMNDYASHDFDNCEVCKNNKIFDYKKFIRWIREDEAATKRRRAEEAKAKVIEAAKHAEEAAKRAEEERIAKLCPVCKERPLGSMLVNNLKMVGGTRDTKGSPCDQCYDQGYEQQQERRKRMFIPASEMLPPRPGYLEAQKAAAEANAAGEAAEAANAAEEAKAKAEAAATKAPRKVVRCIDCGSPMVHGQEHVCDEVKEG